MRSQQSTQNPLFRSLAALILAVFVGAEIMCLVHCHLGGGHGGDAAEPSCHQAASQKNPDEHSPSSPDSPPMSACSTLKNLLASNGTLTLIVPDFPILYTLAPLALAFEGIAIQPEARNSRPARLREWVVTPEVYLGPAIHSLAPPFFS